MKNLKLPRHIVNVLNQALKADSDAVNKLIEARVSCNAILADHPTIQVGIDKENNGYRVGILGILNGIAGAYANGRGRIAAFYEDDLGTKLTKFIIIDENGKEIVE